MIEVAYTNIQSKTKINGLWEVRQGCPLSFSGVSTHITVAEVLAIFTDADTSIKAVQIGDHEIKQYIWLMTPPFFSDMLPVLPECKWF